jgi:arabinoxylan arabinofuranohydrolase
MKKEKRFTVRRITVVALLAAVAVVLSGCGGGDEKGTPSEDQITVTFNLGYDGAQNTPVSVTIAKDGTLGDKLPQNPARGGYTFWGWYFEGAEYTAQTVIAKSVTLTAEWTQNPSDASSFENLTLKTPLKNYSHGNPLMTQEYGADPNILVWEGRLYVYMTSDTLLYNSDGTVKQYDYGTIKSLRVLSTTDMVNWTQHPEIKITDFTGTKSHINNTWAPAFALKDGKVSLYFSNSSSVAVVQGDGPLGPWNSPRSNNITSGTVGNLTGWPDPVWRFDPAVLVDDDNQAYLYFGGGTPSGGSAAEFTSNHPNPRTMRIVKLNDNMYEVDTSTMTGNEIPFSFEASEINKIGNTYYYSYSANPQVQQYAKKPDEYPAAVIIGDDHGIVYATSDNPMGPFTMQGLLLPNPGGMFDYPYNNNHHKMFEYKGKWYIAYHTKLLMFAMNEHPGFPAIDPDNNYRATSIDAVTVKPDGKIDTVKGTREGVSQDGFFDPYRPVNAATMAVMAGITTSEYTPEGAGTKEMKVTGIDSGDWIALRGVDFGSAGAKKFNGRVTPPAARGVIQIKLDGLDGRAVGYVSVEPGQSTIAVDLLRTVTGVHDVVFVFYGQGYDFEQWKFLP